MNIPQVISTKDASLGSMGQEYLATGKEVAMRRWEEGVCDFCEMRSRQYETVGYLISGILELDLDGQSVQCKAGDSWLVPKGAPHRYRIIDSIVAIEATSPPARLNNRDEAIKT